MSASATAVSDLAACRGVSVGYTVGGRRVAALEQVELVIEPGEALALWGPSGSGKTTLLHVLGGLLVPTEGIVVWKGEQLSSLDAKARARARAAGIAYVFQGANLLPTFTAFENVSFAAYPGQNGKSASLYAKRLFLDAEAAGISAFAVEEKLGSIESYITLRMDEVAGDELMDPQSRGRIAA